MKQAMKKMGMTQEDVPATEVIVRFEDREWVFPEPQLLKVNAMGQDNFQLTGEFQERSLDTTPDISEEDVKTVMEQASCSEEEAKEAIKKADGNLAEAILSLQ